MSIFPRQPNDRKMNKMMGAFICVMEFSIAFFTSELMLLNRRGVVSTHLPAFMILCIYCEDEQGEF